MKNICLLLLLSFSQTALAQLRLPAFLSSGMVLQQQKSNRIWGWANANQKVEVTFKGKTYPCFAEADGAWQVFLDAASAGKAGEMKVVSGVEQLTLADILIGEVWVCGGQSNMEWLMGWLPDTYPQELDSAQNDQIRFVTLKKCLATSPQKDVALENPWTPITPASVEECSAVAYFFAKKLQQELKIPIGLVISSWGGTFAQSWTSFEGLHDFPHYTKTFEQYIRGMDLDSIAQKSRDISARFEQKIKDKSAFVKAAIQPKFDDQQWPEMYLPRAWEDQGYPTLDGTVLYRLSFQLTAAEACCSAVLNLPAIDDQDSTFVNGQFVGSIDQWDALRTYPIPPGVLKKGKNVLAIYVRDDRGAGGLNSDEARFNLKLGAKTMPLSGKAKFQVLSVLDDLTGGNGDIFHQPAILFNAMISPILPLSMRGVIWYQGESNASRPWEYRRLFPAMITDWRNRWGQGDFPFLFVQLSSFGPMDEMPPAKSNWAALREAQALTLALPHTAMAVTVDIGDPKDIHPKQKKEVGGRLADQALRTVYFPERPLASGPKFQNYCLEGNRVVLQFSEIGSGLMQKGPKLKSFALAGTDQKFYWANAEIVGDKVIVSHKDVPNPAYLRYAWADAPMEANLFNQEGYPAVPFQIKIYAVHNPVVAHRGAWKMKNLPENSIAALKNAIALGCAGSEFDVRMTADDSLVINHDPSYQGGIIEQTSYADLIRHPLSNGEKLPTLREYLLAGVQNNPGTQLICEIKPSGLGKTRAEAVATQTVALVQSLGIQHRVDYISFDYDILKKILEINPDASTQYLEGDKTPETLKIDGILGVDFHYSVFHNNKDWISRALQNNLLLNAWTVNEASEINFLLDAGFHLITTNEPELALDLFHKRTIKR